MNGSRNLVPKEVQTSNQSISLLCNSNSFSNTGTSDVFSNNFSTSICGGGENENESFCHLNTENHKLLPTILPPPSFDNNARGVIMERITPTTDIPKTPSSNKRYHRTIPRHFTAAVDSNIPQQERPKPEQHHSDTLKKQCQCPVQHVPYNMSVPPSNFLSANVRPQQQPTKSATVAKSMSFNAKNPSTSTHNKMEGSSSSGYSSGHSSLRRMKIKLDNSHHLSSANVVNYCETPNKKIATISKHITSNEINNKLENNLLQEIKLQQLQHYTPVHSHHSHQQQQLHHSQQQIHSILKNSTTKNYGMIDGNYTKIPKHQQPPQQQQQNNVPADLMNTSAFPLQLLDKPKTNKTLHTIIGGGVNEPNPVLPPKMYKTTHRNQSQR
jgi:hypothetical protein